MFRYLLLSSLLFCSFTTLSARISCAPCFQEAVFAIKQLPEAGPLLEKINSEGGVTISARKVAGGFEAYWQSGTRTIIVNTSASRSLSSLICSILFEMHNAEATQQMRQLYSQALRGQISKDRFVKEMEWIEHQNALKTGALLEKGRQRKLFPPEAIWPIERDFERHYQVQKQTGHSEYHAKMYERLNTNLRPRGSSS